VCIVKSVRQRDRAKAHNHRKEKTMNNNNQNNSQTVDNAERDIVLVYFDEETGIGHYTYA